MKWAANLIWVWLLLPFSIYAQGETTASDVQTVVDSWDTTQMRAVIPTLQQMDQTDSLAYIWHMLGVVYYAEHDDLVKAIEVTQEAVRLRDDRFAQSKTNSNAFDLAKSTHNLGVFHKELQHLDEAERYFRAAIPLFDQSDTARAIDSRRELAAVLTGKGDFDQALNFLQLAIRQAERSGLQEVAAECRIDEGSTLLSTQQFDKAAQTLEKARVFYKNLSERDDYQDYNLGAVYLNLGLAFFEKGNYPEALANYQRSLAINEYWSYTDQIIRNYIDIGLVQLRQKRHPEAALSFQKAFQEATRVGDSALQAICMDNLAGVFLDQGAIRKSLITFQDAIQYCVPGWYSSNFRSLPPDSLLEAVGNKTDLIVYLSDKAEAWRALYDQSGDQEHLQQALLTYEKAETVLTFLRYEHQDQNTRIFWRENTRKLYEQALAICSLLDDTAKAFYFLEKSKSVLLLDAILSLQANALIDEETAQREQQLQNEVVKWRDAPDSLVRKKLFAQQAYANFIAELAAENPQYHQVRYGTAPESLSAVQQQLHNDQNLLHYFYGEDHIYSMWIGQKGAVFRALPKDEKLEIALGQYLELLGEADGIAGDPAQFLSLSHRLYSTLVAPVLPQRPEGECTIFPDGLLYYLPFESLLTETSSHFQFGGQPYFHEQQKLSYGYSVQVLKQQAQLPGQENGSAKIFTIAPYAGRSGTLSQLRYSEEVYQFLNRQFPGDALRDQSASKSAFLSGSSEYNILHLSTHAAGGAAHEDPHIWLADTTLWLQEIYGLRLPADLVVLSACETGLGQRVAGEGVMSLAQGFAYAGTKSMIASLWAVNDYATAYIFRRFYQYLSEGHSTAAALHLAKKAYRTDPSIDNRYQSPHYWAGFILAGPDQTIDLRPRSWWTRNYHWVLGGLLLLVIGRVARYLIDRP